MVEKNHSALVVEKFDKNIHDRGAFDCGDESLNHYLKSTARQHMKKGYAQVWVAVERPLDKRIIGYYTLSMSALDPEEPPRKAPVKQVPVVLLGRLAVDHNYQGQMIGARLLMHAQRSAYILSENVGVHALVVDALDENAARFYKKYDFEELTSSPLRLFKTIKDIGNMGLR